MLRPLDALLRFALERTVAVSAPSAGAEIVVSVPSGAVWELLSVRYTFTTSAVVSNRTSFFDVRDQDLVVSYAAFQGAAQPASENVVYIYAAGFGAVVTAGLLQAPLPSPPLLIGGGSQILTNTGNIDSGDAYSSIIVRVREISPLRIVQAARRLIADLDSAGGIPYASIT